MTANEPLVTWADPPLITKGRYSTRWREVAKQLRARPNEWAMVASAAPPSTASHIRTGKLAAFSPAGHFEATARRGPDLPANRRIVYARYVGP